jgi:hypothetical protein
MGEDASGKAASIGGSSVGRPAVFMAFESRLAQTRADENEETVYRNAPILWTNDRVLDSWKERGIAVPSL